ncbi:hypothetical protein DPMN_187182 [Dreissena polymorpha]|uniref:Uncharacterized protein n=1 Tax=Dreissena polymorpha TaxID=45954 RepID=A0A9D4I793_DREPO|nr:hypothetical protein DPMN_187182 [Dreissena polymorpha]
MSIGFLHVLAKAGSVISTKKLGISTVSFGKGCGSGNPMEPSCTISRHSDSF